MNFLLLFAIYAVCTSDQSHVESPLPAAFTTHIAKDAPPLYLLQDQAQKLLHPKRSILRYPSEVFLSCSLPFAAEQKGITRNHRQNVLTEKEIQTILLRQQQAIEGLKLLNKKNHTIPLNYTTQELQEYLISCTKFIAEHEKTSIIFEQERVFFSDTALMSTQQFTLGTMYIMSLSNLPLTLSCEESVHLIQNISATFPITRRAFFQHKMILQRLTKDIFPQDFQESAWILLTPSMPKNSPTCF